MKAYGYFGILEVILKLTIVFLLLFLPYDKLITYAILIVCVSLIMRFIYGYYCKSHFEECHYRFITDHHLMRDMFSFAGWSFLGSFGFSVRDQGLNIVLNLFFNVAVNAAKGIASQVGAVVSGFSQNFQMALNPQITKRYAAGNTESMMRLVFSGCKYSALLMMLIVIPLYFACDKVLELWLDNVAPYTIGFLRLVLVLTLIESMVSPITTALQATGKIMWFQIVVSIILVSNIPLSLFWLSHNANPYIVLYASILTSILALVARLIILHKQIKFSYFTYVKTALIPLLVVTFAAYFITDRLYTLFPKTSLGLLVFIISSLSSILLLSFLIGFNSMERKLVMDAIKKRLYS